MSKTAKTIIEGEIRKLQSKLRRIQFEKDRLELQILELEKTLEGLS